MSRASSSVSGTLGSIKPPPKGVTKERLAEANAARPKLDPLPITRRQQLIRDKAARRRGRK